MQQSGLSLKHAFTRIGEPQWLQIAAEVSHHEMHTDGKQA
jgi:hypothetical protein